MNGRTLATLIIAPVACGLVVGASILLGLERSGRSDIPAVAVFLPGVMYGALFEVFALLPLFLWLKRRASASRWSVFAGGLGLWLILAVGYVAATSELSLPAWLAVLPMVMVPGVVLVSVFALLIPYEQAA